MSNNWIPVTEKLPDSYHDCWITVTFDTGTEAILGFYDQFFKTWIGISGLNVENRGRRVIAWMKLDAPEPYVPPCDTTTSNQ